MDNVKGNAYYLHKILVDVEFLISHTKGKTINEIESEDLLVDSIMFRLIQIAESSEKLTTEFKTLHKDLPWREMRGMRNRIVHDYGVVDLTIICDTVINGIPKLYEQLKEIL